MLIIKVKNHPWMSRHTSHKTLNSRKILTEVLGAFFFCLCCLWELLLLVPDLNKTSCWLIAHWQRVCAWHFSGMIQLRLCWLCFHSHFLMFLPWKNIFNRKKKGPLKHVYVIDASIGELSTCFNLRILDTDCPHKSF